MMVQQNEGMADRGPWRVRAVGVTFDGRQDAIANLDTGQRVWLMPRPENPHSPSRRAVEIVDGEGHSLGWLAEADRTPIRRLMFDERTELLARVKEVAGGFDRYAALGLVIEVWPSVGSGDRG